ncbi:MAG: hypothetical protein WBA87_08565 [Microbacterium sp.]
MTIARGDPFGGELSAAQVAAFKNDPAFIIEEAAEPKRKQKAEAK